MGIGIRRALLALVCGAGMAAASGADSGFAEAALPAGTDSVGTPPGPASIGAADSRPVLRMETTTVKGKSRARRVKESGYAVEVVQTREAKSRTTDIQDLVGAQSGVVVREEGGLGSGASVSLNGLSGKHVRVFLDGIPVEQLGTGLSLGDLPPNAVQSVEVYKGVVPIHLGADALGGALDVRTHPDPKPFLDASWSVGSYGTHRGALSGLWKADSLPVAVRANAFYNRSDNDYSIRWKLVDPVTGKYGPEQDFRRFHDGYESWWASAEAGLVGTRWADQLWAGGSLGKADKEIQHGNSLDRVYGEVEENSDSWEAHLRWENADLFGSGVSTRVWASAGRSETDLVDTSSLQYDWTGTGTPRNAGNGNGEALWYKTHYHLEEATRTGFANLRRSWGESDHFEASWTGTGIEADWIDLRQGTPIPPSEMTKHVGGVSWRHDFFGGRLSGTLFGKHFRQTATLRPLSTWSDDIEDLVEKDIAENGWGAVVSGRPTKALLLKASFEDALRLQETEELLGDGLLLRANADLRPERSRNANLGAALDLPVHPDHVVRAEAAGFVRDIRDKVRLNAEGATSRYENVGKVLVRGVEGDLSWRGWGLLELGANGTWQDLRDRTPGSTTYDVQLPNTPMVYANARASGECPRSAGLPLALRANWSLHHVREYFLFWPVFGDKDTKHRIPTQWSQDAGISVSDPEERVSISVDCRNLTDAVLYDDWRKQKPGRTWAAKLRVSF
jgi:outer membrane receptor protein involved in Fe transport